MEVPMAPSPSDNTRNRNYRRAPYTPYQNLTSVSVSSKNRRPYCIAAPKPGQKVDTFCGLDALRQMKIRSLAARNSIARDVPVGLQSTYGRYVLKIPQPGQRTAEGGESLRSMMGAEQQQIGAVQEVASEKGVDGDDVKKWGYGVMCSECNSVLYSRSLLASHLSQTHGLQAPLLKEVFTSEDDFSKWVESLKNTHCVDFVSTSGTKNWRKGLCKVSYLQCSRSGEKKVNESRQPKKSRSSIKSGRTCAAYLKVRRSGHEEDSTIAVEGCLMHTGHSIDPSRIALDSAEEVAVLQILDRHSRRGSFDLKTCRAMLDPCPRLRLIEDDQLLNILPRWICEVEERRWKRQSPADSGRNISSLVGREEPFPSESHSFHHHIIRQNDMLSYDGTDDFVSVI